MKKVLAIAIVLALVLVSVPLSAHAAVNPYRLYGDVDCNGEVEIFDVTEIQRALAELSQLDAQNRELADYDHDGDMTIFDATAIQRRLADMSVPEGYGGALYNYAHIYNLYASYNSGMAPAGAAVTFTACAESALQGLTYEFLIDNEVVQDRSSENELTYTFDRPGDYTITARVYALYDVVFESQIPRYTVVEPYATDRPIIVGYHFDGAHPTDRASALTVNTVGGEGPYRYVFTITPVRLIEGILPDLKDYRLVSDPLTGSQYLLQDREDTDTSYIPFEALEQYQNYTITIQATDAKGGQSAVVSLDVRNVYYPA